MLSAEIITELPLLAGLESDWDELAVTNMLPVMSPACVMAWWRTLAPAGAEPRVIAVRGSDGELVGVAPFYAELTRSRRGVGLRLPGVELAAGLQPLAAPGYERAVSATLARALADLEPEPNLVRIEGAPLASDWTGKLRQSWPGRLRPASSRYQLSPRPTVSLRADSFDAWLATKSSNFRGEMGRLRRRFTAAGGTTRSSTPDTLRSDIDTFVRLHTSRWNGRGSSSFVELGPRLPALLGDLGETLLRQEGRFRLRLMEVEGESISAQLFLAAGGHVLYVNGGWDQRFARLKPSMLGILAVIEDAFQRGEEVVNLGVGDQHYKLRFADGDDPVVWSMLFPIGIRGGLSMMRAAPMLAHARLRSIIRPRLTQEQISAYLILRERLRMVRAGAR